MEYLVVGAFMRRFEAQPADTAEQACELAQGLIDQSASTIVIYDLQLTPWSLEGLRSTLRKDEDA